MSRRSFLLALSIVLVLVGGTAAALVLLVRHEPDYYRRAFVPPGPARTQLSGECVSEFHALKEAVKYRDRELDLRLTDEQVNSFFAEGFKQERLENSLPEKFSEPRVCFEPGKIRLAFRYGSGLWSSVISMDFGIWLTPEPNVIALELQGLHAGSLPIGTQSFLDSLSEFAEQNSIQISWYRHKGNPVALLRFQTDDHDTPVHLQMVRVDQGSLIIRGKPVGTGSARAAALPVSQPAGN